MRPPHLFLYILLGETNLPGALGLGSLFMLCWDSAASIVLFSDGCSPRRRPIESRLICDTARIVRLSLDLERDLDRGLGRLFRLSLDLDSDLDLADGLLPSICSL